MSKKSKLNKSEVKQLRKDTKNKLKADYVNKDIQSKDTIKKSTDGTEKK